MLSNPRIHLSRLAQTGLGSVSYSLLFVLGALNLTSCAARSLQLGEGEQLAVAGEEPAASDAKGKDTKPVETKEEPKTQGATSSEQPAIDKDKTAANVNAGADPSPPDPSNTEQQASSGSTGLCGDGVLNKPVEQCDNGKENTDTGKPGTCSKKCSLPPDLAIVSSPPSCDEQGGQCMAPDAAPPSWGQIKFSCEKPDTVCFAPLPIPNSNQYICADQGATYNAEQICDGKGDCKDSTDEDNCYDRLYLACKAEHGACTANTSGQSCDAKFKECQGRALENATHPCGDGSAVQYAMVCDGKKDCETGADEAKCAPAVPDCVEAGGACYAKDALPNNSLQISGTCPSEAPVCMVPQTCENSGGKCYSLGQPVPNGYVPYLLPCPSSMFLCIMPDPALNVTPAASNCESQFSQCSAANGEAGYSKCKEGYELCRAAVADKK